MPPLSPLHNIADLSSHREEKKRPGPSGGLVKNIGYSIYSPEIHERVTKVFWPDIVQAPYNVFDQRLDTSGWLNRLRERGTEIHTRSVFLQGLLPMKLGKMPPYFDKWNKHFAAWDALVASYNVRAMDYALNYVIADSRIDRVIVGVDNSEQLSELLIAYNRDLGFDLKGLGINDLDLIDPSRWRIQ